MVESVMGQSARNDIQATNALFVRGLETGDRAALLEVYAPGARLLVPRSPFIEGRGRIERYWCRIAASGVLSARLVTATLDVRDDLAVEVGRYRLGRAPSAPAAALDSGTYVVVHRLQPDGTWRWAVDIRASDG